MPIFCQSYEEYSLFVQLNWTLYTKLNLFYHWIVIANRKSIFTSELKLNIKMILFKNFIVESDYGKWRLMVLTTKGMYFEFAIYFRFMYSI